jgi:hypothetical protein
MVPEELNRPCLDTMARYARLRALVEGAELATRALWGKERTAQDRSWGATS